MAQFFEKLKRFFTRTIWSFDIDNASFLQRAVSNTAKVCVIAVRRFLDDKVMTKAAALTYSTLFAIVPILALIFAIARGFGFENIVTSLLENGIIGQNDTVDTITQFIDQYLEYAHTGAFIGIGLLFLLWSVYSLADGIEDNLNSIWQVKNSRKMSRKITDYFSLLLLIPIAIICLSGLSVLASSIMTRMQGFVLLGGFAKFIITALPYLVAGLILTGFYMFMPNTKVKFKYAIVPGFVAGCVFQVLQNLYFQGQLSLSSYNAIYGGFAALPLFLFWCNISWSIILFGCELSYVSQNNDSFTYYKEPEKISRHHQDFYALMVLSCICKRFNAKLPAMKPACIARELHIPIRMVNSALNDMTDAGLIESVNVEGEEDLHYAPAYDTAQITVRHFFSALNHCGFEDTSYAPDCKLVERLKSIDEARKCLSGGIWETPVAEL